MADRETEIIAKIASGVSGSLNARAWDRLTSSDPFISHAFLSALEDSKSVGVGTGWTAAPILVEDEADHLIAAAPAYLKTHSQGEYVFDHGWAEAFGRAGGQYYPKLQISVPFTPVPGPRLLGQLKQQLLAAAEAIAVQNQLSSAHITFMNEASANEAERRGWLIRHGVQYHWFNRGFESFDNFLEMLRHSKRKSIRKERRQACDGLEIRALRGSQISPRDWDSDVGLLPVQPARRKWGRTGLFDPRGFLTWSGERMGDAVLLFLAYRGSRRIAGALELRRHGHPLRPLLGLYRRRAVPSLRALLLQSDGMGDRARPKVSPGRGPGRAQGVQRAMNPCSPKVRISSQTEAFAMPCRNSSRPNARAFSAEIEWLRRDLPYLKALPRRHKFVPVRPSSSAIPAVHGRRCKTPGSITIGVHRNHSALASEQCATSSSTAQSERVLKRLTADTNARSQASW